jgi:CTP:molybdopterin cytidylyltransferase MocA
MSLTMCVLLWAHPDAAAALIAYEDKVLGLVSEHGGTVVQRARSDGADGHPLEIQTLQFPSGAALHGYLTDGRRLALAEDRDRAVARTEIMNVDLVGPSQAGSGARAETGAG